MGVYNLRRIIISITALLCLGLCMNIKVFASNANPNAKVYHGSGDNQSLFDAVDEAVDNQNQNIDDEAMKSGISAIDGTIGVLISFIIYLIFAFLGFTTATDLLYIGFPGIRPTLYSSSSQSNGQMGMQGMNNGNSDSKSGTCLISNELRQQVEMTGDYINMKEYFKARAVSIVLTVVILFILVGSTFFTDFGLNIGALIYDFVSSLLGF